MADSMKTGFMRDEFGRLSVAPATSLGALTGGESMKTGFVRDSNERLVVVGAEGESLIPSSVVSSSGAAEGDVPIADGEDGYAWGAGGGGGISEAKAKELDTAAVKVEEERAKTAEGTKQASLGFTPENVAEKDTTGTLGASDTKYPSQKAVKTYVDNQDALSVLKATLTTKGDIYAATGAGTVVRRAVGTNGKVLSAESGEADGLKWIGSTDISEHGFSVTAAVTARTYRGFYAQLATGETKKLVGMMYSLGAGTKAKISVMQNGAAVTGFKEVEAKTEVAEVSGKTVAVAAKDRFDLKVESIEGTPEDLIVTLFFERTHS